MTKDTEPPPAGASRASSLSEDTKPDDIKPPADSSVDRLTELLKGLDTETMESVLDEVAKAWGLTPRDEDHEGAYDERYNDADDAATWRGYNIKSKSQIAGDRDCHQLERKQESYLAAPSGILLRESPHDKTEMSKVQVLIDKQSGRGDTPLDRQKMCKLVVVTLKPKLAYSNLSKLLTSADISKHATPAGRWGISRRHALSALQRVDAVVPISTTYAVGLAIGIVMLGTTPPHLDSLVAPPVSIKQEAARMITSGLFAASLVRPSENMQTVFCVVPMKIRRMMMTPPAATRTTLMIARILISTRTLLV